MFLDINECEMSPCHQNANCKDVDGSYECTCKTGYSGDGKQCEGIYRNITFYDITRPDILNT